MWNLGGLAANFFESPVKVDLKGKSQLGNTGISSKSAIYIFRSKEEIAIPSIYDFNNGLYLSPMRMYDNNTYKLFKHEVYYIGECDNLGSRTSAHLSSSDQDTRTYGLHLSNSNRIKLRDVSQIVIFPFKEAVFPSKSASEQKECREAIESRIKGIYLPCIGK